MEQGEKTLKEQTQIKRCNSVSKYNDRSKKYRQVVFSMPIVQKGPKRPFKSKLEHTEEEMLEIKNKAISHAINAIRDYICTNTDLCYFVTYTLSPDKVPSRYDEKKIYELIRNWLANNVKNHGLKYILIAEHHKDGAWHFHGFVNKEIPWKLGFSFVRKLNRTRDLNASIRYITKYIAKEKTKFNGRYYLHSQNLVKPTIVHGYEDYTNLECDYETVLPIGQGIGMKIKDFI